jgi:hypothetical protein
MGHIFPELVSAILPLVSDAEIGSVALHVSHDNGETIAKGYPDQLLELLAAVLPDYVTRWPMAWSRCSNGGSRLNSRSAPIHG